MPVPRHFRFVVRGKTGTSEEKWSFGWHMSRVSTAGPAAGKDDIDEAAVTTAINAYVGSVYVQEQVVIEDWRAYVIETTGKLAPGATPLLSTRTPAHCRRVATPAPPSPLRSR